MDNQTFVPVTEQQALETNINQSVKIGKQVMKKQLQQACATKLVEYHEAKVLCKATDLALAVDMRKEIYASIDLQVINDAELDTLRVAMLALTCVMPDSDEMRVLSSNTTLVADRSENVLGCLTNTYSPFHTDNLAKLMQGESFDVSVQLHLKEFSLNDYGHDTSMTQFYEYVVPDNFKERILALLALDEKAVLLNKQYNDLELKLTNIDQVAEEMEAQLLVNELNKTEQGKAALAVASNLVSEMLGTTPALLDLGEK